MTVTFITFSGLGTERLVRFTDAYRLGHYTSETKSEVIAEGPGGYVH